MAVSRIYCATGLIGGTTGDLDTIDGADLANNDMAIVIDSTTNTVYFYKMNVSGAAAESSPTVIVPDDNNDGGNKNWELSSMYVNDITISDDVVLIADDVKIGDSLEVVGATQFGDADGTGGNVTFYSDTAGDHIVFDKTAKTLTFTDIGLIIDGTNIGTSVDLNNTHRASDGSDHTFLDQSVISGANPTFDMANMSGNPDINGGTIDGVTIGGAVAPTVTNLGSVATCDINGGTIDGVTIGGAAAPTVTNLGSVATCDINGGSIDGVTLGAASACTFTSLTAANVGQINFGDASPDSTDQHTGPLFIEADVDQNTVGINGLLVLSSDGSWDDADKDAVATVGMLALATDSGTGTKTLMLQGFARDTGWSWTPGAQLYVGDNGAITASIPTGSGDFLQVVGYALNATTVYFKPSSDFLEIA